MDTAQIAKAAQPQRILVTGAMGLLGHLLSSHLAQYPWRYEVNALDRTSTPSKRVPPHLRPSTPSSRFHLVDLTRRAAVRATLREGDVVVHLAATPDLDARWLDLVRDNLIAHRAIFNAARAAKARGVVFASSLATMTGHSWDRPLRLTHRSGARPTTFYGATKVLGEWIARYHFAAAGLSSICLRLGAINAEDAPPVGSRWSKAWCSHGDFLSLVEACIERIRRVPRCHATLLGCSDLPGTVVDMSATRAELGIGDGPA